MHFDWPFDKDCNHLQGMSHSTSQHLKKAMPVTLLIPLVGLSWIFYMKKKTVRWATADKVMSNKLVDSWILLSQALKANKKIQEGGLKYPIDSRWLKEQIQGKMICIWDEVQKCSLCTATPSSPKNQGERHLCVDVANNVPELFA